MPSVQSALQHEQKQHFLRIFFSFYSFFLAVAASVVIVVVVVVFVLLFGFPRLKLTLYSKYL